MPPPEEAVSCADSSDCCSSVIFVWSCWESRINCWKSVIGGRPAALATSAIEVGDRKSAGRMAGKKGLVHQLEIEFFYSLL
jgi:hypothetical protein